MRISFGFALGIAGWFTTWGPLSADDFKLPPDCTLPFDNIATKPDPAAGCGFDGSGTGGAALTPDKVLEDHAKNNFCGDASDITTVSFSILKQMQAKAPPKGPLASSRDSLHNFFQISGKKIGEGNVVRLLAFVKEAHISDCEAGEDVNCKTKGVPNNDFHIPLVDPSKRNARNLPECTSVTAEMSPHFRPAKWSKIDLKTPINPVRVTGQLFYDNSHEPCQMKNGVLTGPRPAAHLALGDPPGVRAGRVHQQRCGEVRRYQRQFRNLGAVRSVGGRQSG